MTRRQAVIAGLMAFGGRAEQVVSSGPVYHIEPYLLIELGEPQLRKLVVRYQGSEITLSAAEIWAALQPTP